jgi:hypothetical protein
LIVDEALIEEDPEVFDCDTCEVAQALASLDDANREAWTLYRKVVTRLSGDLNAGGTVLERLTREMGPSEFDETWRRLMILYNAICPQPEPPKET